MDSVIQFRVFGGWVGGRMAGWLMGISTDYLDTLVLNWTGLQRFIFNLVSARKLTKPHFPQFSTFFPQTDRQTDRMTEEDRRISSEPDAYKGLGPAPNI